MPSTVFFDLDGTLVDQERAFVAAYSAVASCAGIEATEEFRSAIPRIADDLLSRWGIDSFIKRCRFGGRDLLWGDPAPLRPLMDAAPQYREAVWNAVLARFTPESAATATTLAIEFRECMEAAVVAYPEVDPVLDALSRRHRLAVITNGMPAAQAAKLRRLGLENYFEKIIASATIGAGKPAAEIFDCALREMGAEAGQAVMVGDSLEGDIAGARALGWRTFWINRSGRDKSSESAQADHELSELSQLAQFL